MADESVKFQVSGAVGTITLNRPESRNALTPEMIGELGKAVESALRPTCGPCCSPARAARSAPGPTCATWWRRWTRRGRRASQAIRELADALHSQVVLPLRRLPKPVVAGINGAAAGAGFSLTLAADLRVASQSSRFLMAYANIGAPADGGSTWLLPRLLGAGRAMELYLASQPIGAPRALELGLVTQVCSDEELDRHALVPPVSPKAPLSPMAASRSCTRRGIHPRRAT